jgi:hypothetical protein
MDIVRTLVIGVAVVALCAPIARAGDVPVHKCRDAEGRIAYQDQPCRGETLPAPLLDPAPAWRPPSVEAPTTATPSQREPAMPVAPAPNPTPLPTLYRCTDFKGKSRVTAIPDRRGRYVPLWVLDRFSTPFPAPHGSIAGRPRGLGASGALYTWVEDDCRPMPRAEMCVWWTTRLREVDQRVLSTFFDERLAYREEQAGLREYLKLFCRS